MKRVEDSIQVSVMKVFQNQLSAASARSAENAAEINRVVIRSNIVLAKHTYAVKIARKQVTNELA